MQCKDCVNFRKSKRLELSNELIANYGTCDMSGSVCKTHDYCKNGSFEKK
ncbi:MAG: hypothetical protein ACOZCL_05435 [Bacillota bacterium]